MCIVSAYFHYAIISAYPLNCFGAYCQYELIIRKKKFQMYDYPFPTIMLTSSICQNMEGNYMLNVQQQV